jgi:hypothetical protein
MFKVVYKAILPTFALKYIVLQIVEVFDSSKEGLLG